MSDHPIITDPTELQGRLLYAIIVAGKSARFADCAMERLGQFRQEGESWFAMLRRIKAAGTLRATIEASRTGNYGRMEKSFDRLSSFSADLTTVRPCQLEQIPGIGPKTSRFFILWCRPHERLAALDVHVLRWLREQGHTTPLSTPTGQMYVKLERLFLEEADARGLTPRDLDHRIWCKYSNYEKAEPIPARNGGERGQ